MTEDSQPTSQATNNELAAFYLRDRDTPCPNCTYNRRDGTTSTCPECGESIYLIATKADGFTRHHALANITMLILLWITISEIAINLIALAHLLHYAIEYSGVYSPSLLVWQVAITIAWFTLLLLIIRRKRAIKNNTHESIRKIFLPIVVLFTFLYIVKIGFFTQSLFFQ